MVSQTASALTVSAVGDIMMGTNYPDGTPVVELDFFKLAQPYLKQTDIRFGNFEGTLYDGPQNPDGKSSGPNRYIFRTPTHMVGQLTSAGFNVFSLANNHAHDFGAKGLQSTKATLSKAGLQFSSKEGEVAKFKIGGQSVALISADFYPGRRSVTKPESTYSEIKELKKKFDLVIVSAHVGGEGVGADHVSNHSEIFLGENRGNSVAFAHGAIDAGADLILMAGPHVPRGLEIHRGRLIAYSLGNFLTERGISLSGASGLAPLLQAELDKDGRFLSGKIISFQQAHGAPLMIDKKHQAARMISELSSEDFPHTQPSFTADGTFYPYGENVGPK